MFLWVGLTGVSALRFGQGGFDEVFGKGLVAGPELLGYGVGEGVEIAGFDGADDFVGHDTRWVAHVAESGVVGHVGFDGARVDADDLGVLFSEFFAESLGEGIRGCF